MYYVIALFAIAVIFIAWSLLISKKPDARYKGIKEKWDEIDGLMKNGSPLSWKLAVIEADKLLDSALKEAHMRGETMGERLRFSVHKFPKMRKVWEAHILRNNLVHERDADLSRVEAEKAVNLFKEGLKTLGAL